LLDAVLGHGQEVAQVMMGGRERSPPRPCRARSCL